MLKLGVKDTQDIEKKICWIGHMPVTPVLWDAETQGFQVLFQLAIYQVPNKQNFKGWDVVQGK